MKINARDYEPKELFKIIREWTELTQEEFAKKINVSKGTVQNYEQGKRNYTFKSIKEICEENGINIIFEKKK